MRKKSRMATGAIVVVVLALALLSGSATAALAGGRNPTPIPGGFCGYWGPNFSYVFPDGTVISCG